MTESPDITCPRILIVDDDPDHCRLLGEALAMYFSMDDPDSEIHSVFSGRNCLALKIEDFDIILLDLHLPDMTGLEVLDEILDRADVPVIFVTGENDLAVAAEAIGRDKTWRLPLRDPRYRAEKPQPAPDQTGARPASIEAAVDAGGVAVEEPPARGVDEEARNDGHDGPADGPGQSPIL